MRCAGCGKDNPPGARYCVRCGVEQALPTPIAAVAAAGARLRAVPAPAASRSQPAADSVGRPEGDTRPRLWEASKLTAAKRSAPPAEPLATDGNVHGLASRTLIGAALAIAVVALLVAAFVLWRWFAVNDAADGTRTRSSIMSSFPADATPRSPQYAQGAVPAPASTVPSAGSAADVDATAASRASTLPNREPAPDLREPVAAAPVETPVEIKPLPSRAAAGKGQRRSAAAKPPEPAPAEAPAAPQPEPEAPVVAAAAPVTEPVGDRWARMNDERSRCTREDFIARVVCDQRVRLRYCNGYWGKVPECPANPSTSEHGQ